MTTAEWLALLHDVRAVGAFQWMARCPNHPDANPSLKITQEPALTLLHCFADCPTEAVVTKLGRTMADLYTTVTVAALAALKKLPVATLLSFGLRDGGGGVLIPYFDAAGQLIAEKKRTALAAKNGSRWPHGKALRAYGEWKLGDAQAAKYLLVVEGESDAWCAWSAGIPCLGIPGASATKTLLAEHLNGLNRLFILQEPDTGGQHFVAGVAARLREFAAPIEAFVLTMPNGQKDLADLHAADPARFVERYRQLVPAPLDLAATATVVTARAADSRPAFLVPELYDLADLGGELWDLVAAVNTPPSLFRFGDGLAWIEHDVEGRPFTRPLNEPRLALWLADRIRFYTEIKDIERPAHPPALKTLLVTPEPPVPGLTRIVHAPGFTPDGEIYDQPGYHAGARVYYAPADGFAMPPVPRMPSPAEIQAATALVLEPLLDFPFVEDADRANALAAFLTILVRDLIPGPTPLFLFSKPSPGTGASLLVEALTLVATGRVADAGAEPGDEEEWRKNITATLEKAPAVVFYDNLRHALDSGHLSRTLTAETTDDRPLGRTDKVHYPNRAVWLATGNNVTMSTEIIRRVVPVNLDAQVERPWLRERDGLVTFRHSDLRAWCAAERGRLVAAALTLGRAWIAAGRPSAGPAPRALPMHSAWATVLGGILMVAGVAGLCENLDEFYETADLETEYIKVFLGRWWMRFRERLLTPRDLYEELLVGAGSVPIPLAGSSEQARLTSFGMYLRRHRQRIFDLVELGGRPVKVQVVQTGTPGHTRWQLKSEGAP
jgi:putative DNA primase/helicase